MYSNLLAIDHGQFIISCAQRGIAIELVLTQLWKKEFFQVNIILGVVDVPEIH